MNLDLDLKASVMNSDSNNTNVNANQCSSGRTIEFLQWEEFVSGWGAGLFNVTLTFPIHKLMFRQMLLNIPTSSAFEQIRKEGLTLLYRGLLPPLMQKTISSSIMFGSYHYYSSLFCKEFPNINTLVVKSSAAAAAGMTEALLTPLERLQTVLQDTRYHKNLTNTGHAIRVIWSQHGFLEFYRGASAVLVRNSITNIIFFGLREKAQKLLPPPKNRATKYLSDFLSGGVLGAGLSCIFYPLNVVKTRLQCQLGGPFESLTVTFVTLYNERGRKLRNVYRGVHLNLVRSLISWGIINASYELIKSLIHSYQAKSRSSSTLEGSSLELESKKKR